MSSELTSTAPTRSPAGRFVTRNGRRLYEITHVDEMPPFLMTVVSDSDLWAYLSSSGALTAGRVEPERCLFPYETDDRLHRAGGLSGPVTIIRLPDGTTWRPLDPRPLAASRVRRLLRTPVGDSVVLEETDETSGITFRSEWSLSDVHGVIRRCEIELADGREAADIELLDGLVNLMPANVPAAVQLGSSTLVDAYKRAELDADLTLAVYALEAAISDQPEAQESLRANVVWRAGLDGATVTLNDDALSEFERGHPVSPEHLTTGRRGAYLCHARLVLEPGQIERWAIAGDVHLGHAAVVRRRRWLGSGVDRLEAIEQSLRDGAERLAGLLDDADGSQLSADEAACAAHRSNVLFNAMRGGVPPVERSVDVADFRRFVRSRHMEIADRHDGFVSGLGDQLSLGDLVDVTATTGDEQLVRLALEYLPLTFGRRHGDPSRPWNRFRIPARRPDGSRSLGYEGNWRDIFQNWEAVCRSYPEMLPGVIAKFVNASTVDGHNPYRISESGIDWEVPDPEDPWSNIGYWGDHQVVYLLRLLEQLQDTDPGSLGGMLERPMFSYADVPYTIRSFDALLRDPRDSIFFDAEQNERISERARRVGADGRLVLQDSDEPTLVTLLEKLLVPVLAKVSNMVPGGGIWMNTQRPEWNDANNALAGYGLSMVTLYQLRRFADFGAQLLNGRDSGETPMSDAIGKWCDRVLEALHGWLDAPKGSREVDDSRRWTILEELGRAASRARERIGERGLGQAGPYPVASVKELFRLVREACELSIREARRSDGLYESYNVLHLDEARERASVERLHPMLEGQVAVLSAGVLDTDEVLGVLDSLFRSELYREDQRTFMLYPRVDRPPFLDRNAIPDDAIGLSPLLQKILHENRSPIASRDEDGVARFDQTLETRRALESALEALRGQPGWADLVERDAGGVLAAYEETFHHARFTGRSGTMHKYEGIGSVYWHMVSKLLLAAQECVYEAIDRSDSADRIGRLSAAYRRVRQGLGMNKSPREFGAVPHEPYSHTPWGSGAQQPGMTGQVKEGVLARFGELGVRLRSGELRFEPVLLEAGELLGENIEWRVRGVRDATFALDAGAIGFSICGTPVVLSAGEQPRISISTDSGGVEEITGPGLGQKWTREVLGRSGKVVRIDVRAPLGLPSE